MKTQFAFIGKDYVLLLVWNSVKMGFM